MSDEVTRQMREQREDAGKELAKLREDRDRWKVLAESIESLREDRDRWKTEAETWHTTVVNTAKELGETQRVKDTLVQDLAATHQQLQDIRDANAEIIELREERDKWKVEAATRFNQITGLNTKVDELKEEISHLRGLRRQNDAVIKELRMLVVAGLKG